MGESRVRRLITKRPIIQNSYLVFSFAPLAIFFLDLFHPRCRFLFHPFSRLASFVLLLIGLFLLSRRGIGNAHARHIINVQRKR